MTDPSFKTSLRSFSILGGGNVVTTVANILKMKVTAEILGPSGVGLVGIYSSLVQTVASIASLGIGGGVTRQLAEATGSGDEESVARTRRAVFWLTAVLSIAGSVVFLIFSRPIASLVLGTESHGTDVAWLSIGVALTVVVSAQAGILAGLHRVNDLAIVDVIGSAIGMVLGILAVLLLRDHAPVTMVLIVPALTMVISYFRIARIGRPKVTARQLHEMSAEVKPILRIGLFTLYAGVIYMIAALFVRGLVQRSLGYDASGLFQSAWAIGMAYQGFLVASVVSDFFPRLTKVKTDRAAAAKLINEQVELSLLICLPFTMAMIGFAPWVIHAFYTPQFAPAADVLRWLLVGDLFKMACNPLAFTLIAFGFTRPFAINQTLAVASWAVTAFVGIPHFGLPAAGIGYLVMWMAYFPIPWLSVRRRLGFRWSAGVRRQALLSVLATVAVALAILESPILGAIVGGFLSLASALLALLRISVVFSGDGRLGSIAAIGKSLSSKSKNSRFVRFVSGSGRQR